MKGIKILVILFLVSSVAFAQRGLELTLKYNESSNKYEVYAKPNFTKRNFFLGPSQITVVVPSSAADEKLRISNIDGGAWDDNSVVFAPGANSTRDFHGIATLGAKVDFVEGNETHLFSFYLSKEINSSEVSLFENGRDPNSSALGMKGGDFANSLNDALSDDVYLRNYKEVKKIIVNPKEDTKTLLEFEDSNLVIYPNITKDDFRVSLNNVDDDDLVTMVVSTEMGRELIRLNTTKKSLEEKTFKVPSEISSQNLVVRVKSGKKHFGRKLVLNRE